MKPDKRSPLTMLLALLSGAAMIVAAAGCTIGSDGNDDDDSDPSSTMSTSTTGPNDCLTTSTDGACVTLDIGGTPRHYFLRQPVGTFTTKPGLLVVMHGLGDSLEFQMEYFQAKRLADELNFVLALPRGTQLTGPSRTGREFWDATSACCFIDELFNPAAPAPDDVGFLNKVIDDQIAAGADPKRVVFFGYSNGGYMSQRMACEYSEKITAIVTQSGSNRRDLDLCAPANPVAMMHIHGTADASVNYLGSSLNRNILGYEGLPGFYFRAIHPSADALAGHWAKINGCTSASTTSDPFLFSISNSRVEYDDALELIPRNLADHNATVKNWTSCTGAAVSLVKVDGGTHTGIYSEEPYYATVRDFLAANATRTATAVPDPTPAPHARVADSQVSIAAITGGGTARAAAFFTRRSETELGYQVDLSGIAASEVVSIAIHNGTAAAVGSQVASLYTAGGSTKFGGSSLFGAASVAATDLLDGGDYIVQLTTSTGAATITLSGELQFNAQPPVVSGTITSSGTGTVAGTYEIKLLGAGYFSYKVNLTSLNGATPTGASANAGVSSIVMKYAEASSSVAQSYAVYPLPPSLPGEYDFIGEGAFTTLTQSGGFKFTDAAAPQTGASVAGFLELFTGQRGLYEGLFADPQNLTVEVISGFSGGG